MSNLPEDIGRIVFELATDAGSGPALALVSKKVRSWTEPILYRSISLSDKETAELLYRTFGDPATSKPAGFWATYVKVFVLSGIPTSEDTAKVLRACKGIQKLAIWSYDLKFGGIKLPELIESFTLSPYKLSLWAKMLTRAPHPFSGPIFRNLTHLEVDVTSKDDWKWDNLSQLKQLTHFSLDLQAYYEYPEPDLVEVVKTTLSSSSPLLRILVLWIQSDKFYYARHEEEIRAIGEGDVDPRAVLAYLDFSERTLETHSEHAIYRSFTGLVEEWAGVHEKRDFWSEATEKVEERQRRQSQPSESRE